VNPAPTFDAAPRALEIPWWLTPSPACLPSTGLGKVQAAIGFDIHFGDRIEVRGSNVADNDQLAAKLPLSQRMYHALRRGPMTLAALAEETGGAEATLDRYTRRSPNKYKRLDGVDGVVRIGLVERRIA
jgi:hypothetical protein